jgi:hypothetical protein
VITQHKCIQNVVLKTFVLFLFVVPVTGRGGLQGCEMLRIQHCLDNRLTDGGKVVSPMNRPHSTPEKHYYFSGFGSHLC